MKLKDKYWHDMFKNQWGQAGVHDLMKELRAILDEYDGDRMLVGEDENIDYMGNGEDELQLVFNFPLANTSVSPQRTSARTKRQSAWRSWKPSAGGGLALQHIGQP